MIAFAQKEDKKEIQELFNQCFPEDIAFNNYFFQEHFDYKNTLVYRLEGRIVAMLQMLSYSHSQLGEVTYIYGACTAVDYRGRGLMGSLLEVSFQEDIKNGRLASVLIPAERSLFNYYGGFGYRESFFCSDIIYNRADYSGYRLEDKVTIREAVQGDAELFAQLYAKILAGLNISFIERSIDYFLAQLKMYLELGGVCYILYYAEIAVGYCFMLSEGEISYAQEIVVIEDIYKDMLINAIFEKEKIDRLRVTAPLGDKPMGCIKTYGDISVKNGYMNLMFN